MATESSDLVVCVDDSGYETALDRRKLYALLPDAESVFQAAWSRIENRSPTRDPA
jgi:hypothetical protein